MPPGPIIMNFDFEAENSITLTIDSSENIFIALGWCSEMIMVFMDVHIFQTHAVGSPLEMSFSTRKRRHYALYVMMMGGAPYGTQTCFLNLPTDLEAYI